MITATPRKPVWPPSGKLSPQHRQWPDTYAEALLARTVGDVAPLAWGLARLSIDDRALADGTFRVTRIEGRLACGGPLFLAGDEPLARALPASRPLERVRVHVGMAKTWLDAPAVTDEAGDTAPVRYRRVRTSEASWLVPHLRILFDDEGATTHDRLPVAQVHWAGRPVLDPLFTPPMLRLLPGSGCDGCVRDVVSALVARRAALVAARDARALDLQALDLSQVPALLLLSAVNQALAVLEPPNRATYLSPADLHEVLANLLGALERLAGRPATRLPAYVHDDPGPGVRTLSDRIVSALPEIARTPHAAFPLQRIDARTFSLRLDAPELVRKRAYLVASGAAEATLAHILPAFAKIASTDALPTILHAATKGAQIAVEFDVPPSLPSSANHCVFRVDTRSPYWGDILERRSLLVHVPEAPPGLALSLCALVGGDR